MNKDKKVEDIVAMLDNFMQNGGGHMNITVQDTQSETIKINTFKSSDCAAGNMACSVPTLTECIDNE
ncbi:hypothetical protein lbkm_3215 [Lachnospiraceae bacterium KM106-2]|nr:hypothetical protein lbkm_3215 [Lachnospiraceae bacterium KM106-2]